MVQKIKWQLPCLSVARGWGDHVENLLTSEVGNRYKIMLFHPCLGFDGTKLHIISDLRAIIRKKFVILHSTKKNLYDEEDNHMLFMGAVGSRSSLGSTGILCY